MRLGVLTSVATRHRYFARRLADAFDVVAVAYESTGYDHASVGDADLTPEERQIVLEHFAGRSVEEERRFGAHAAALEANDRRRIRYLSPGELNATETVGFLEIAGVEVVAVFGTNLIKRPLLDRFAGRLVNLHLGLSPYYRGTATNFYPLLYEEPQFVGATVHLIDGGIDSGPILRHARPAIVRGDTPHTIGCKAIVAGVDAMVAVLRGFARGAVQAVPQWAVEHSRLCLRRDYHPRQVVELHHKWRAGLIESYLQRAADVSGKVKLVE